MAPAQFATSLERLEGYSTESRRSSDQITKALSLAIVIDNDPAVARATAIHWLSVMYNVDFSPYVDTNVITGTPGDVHQPHPRVCGCRRGTLGLQLGLCPAGCAPVDAGPGGGDTARAENGATLTRSCPRS